jgi:hypothetical protein
MKSSIKIFLVTGLIFIFSCEEQGLIVKCPDCTADEPEETNLDVKLDQKYSDQIIEVKVYEGNLEDSILYSSTLVMGTHPVIKVTVNKKYTVTATYHILDEFYVVIDSATPKVKYDKTTCDDPCYFVYDKVIDLRLKYTALINQTNFRPVIKE